MTIPEAFTCSVMPEVSALSANFVHAGYFCRVFPQQLVEKRSKEKGHWSLSASCFTLIVRNIKAVRDFLPGLSRHPLWYFSELPPLGPTKAGCGFEDP